MLDVLAHYGSQVRSETALPLGNRGGFSGARLWKLTGLDEPVCLKATPGEHPPRVAHDLMMRARAAGLDFVPRLYLTTTGSTFVATAGCHWEVMQWMPGRADFRDDPNDERLENAMIALARIHRACHPMHQGQGPSPAVASRSEVLRTFRELAAKGWTLRIARDDPVGPWAERAWHVVAKKVDTTLSDLSAWSSVEMPLQYCLRDIRHDHVLYAGNRVAGIVDYGQVAVDSATSDLSRLLGSLLGTDNARVERALDCYSRERELDARERKISRIMIEATHVASLANWLLGLFHHQKVCGDRAAAARRLAELVEQVHMRL